MQTITTNNALDLIHISPFAFERLISIVFSFNNFVYDDKFFRQIKGIAMGAICGPAIAYIVDLSNFQNQFKNLRLNIVTNSSVNFLDVNLSYNHFPSKIIIKLYIKPTNPLSYLSLDSNQSRSIFKNIPKSIFV